MRGCPGPRARTTAGPPAAGTPAGPALEVSRLCPRQPGGDTARGLACSALPAGEGLPVSRPLRGLPTSRAGWRCCPIRWPGTPSGRWPVEAARRGSRPGFAPGARCPLAGLLLALQALQAVGLLECARAVYGRMRNGFYGLTASLLTWCSSRCCASRALKAPPASRPQRWPGAGPGRRHPHPARSAGRVLGLDRAPEVKTIRLKLAELVRRP